MCFAKRVNTLTIVFSLFIHERGNSKGKKIINLEEQSLFYKKIYAAESDIQMGFLELYLLNHCFQAQSSPLRKQGQGAEMG